MAENTHISSGQGGFREVSDEITGQDTDGSGDITYTFSSLKRIESKADVEVQAESGYVANVTSISGNQVTFRVFESAGSNAAMSAATGASDEAFNLKARGY